ncbi:MAG: hypothetical protein K8S98_02170 [Planctomycetes bacterium]|nr:hypothetical protein [Planctomycetota bacterium]
MITQAMIDDALDAGSDDWVQVVQLIEIVERLGHFRTSNDTREAVIALIRSLLERGLMRIGDVVASGFTEWDVPHNDAIDRVRREWELLEGALSLGDICWLDITAEGKRVFEERRGRR